MPSFYGAVDLVKNELRNAVIQNLGAAPSSPVQGQIYFDSTAKILFWYNGTVWVSASGATMSSTVTTAAIGDAPVPGVATTASAGDHKHGMPAFGGTVTAETTFGLASSLGAAATLPRSDHTHGSPALGTTPSIAAIGDAAAGGSATTASANDHRHGMPAFGIITAEQTYGAASANGAAATIARSDHTHGNPSLSAIAPTGNNQPGAAAAVGVATSPTRSDHVHGWAAALAALDMGGFKVINLADPTVATDGVTKNYVDNAIAGLSWKAPARAASTVNIAALSGTMTVDGVALIAGDRILVKNQTTQTANGIYVVAAGAWARSIDANTGAQLLNATVYIEEGTTQADTAWTGTANAPITVGTTNLPFVQFSGAGTFTAGNGLTLTGNVFAVGAGTGILSTPGTTAVDTSVIATVVSLANYVPTTRTVTAGAGLTGGGDLSANRTLDVVAGDTSLTVAADSVIVNTAVIATVASVTAAVTGMAKKFAGALAGTASPEVVTHNLNTRDVQVMVLNGASPYTAVVVDWDATTVNTVTIRYNPALGAGYRVVVVG